MKPKHGFFLFVSSCIPGCGQMYQGYMKRGTSLMIVFFGLFAVSVFLQIGAMAVFMLPAWLYAFFDSYNLRSRIADGFPPDDEMLFGLSDMDSARAAALFRKRHSLIGWGLVAIGCWTFYTLLTDWLFEFLGQFFYDTWWLQRILVYDVPRLVLTVAIIALGIWFIRGPKTTGGDIPPFVPPMEPEEDAADRDEEEARHEAQ